MPHAVSAHGACSRDEPGPEVVADEEDLPADHVGPIEDEARHLERAVLLVAPVAEERLGEPVLVGHLEVAGRDDLVRVDVLGGERHDPARERLEGLGHVSGHRLARSTRSPGSRRGSATTPAIADAAAVSGEARNVRPPFPWRPSKFRFEVEIAYWPGDSWSPFIAMHIEQPASRHSAPAARKISWRPSRSASRFTSSEPGHDHHPDAVGDLAILEDRGREAQVADPAVRARADEDDVDLLAEDLLAGL